jgi:uncharacterized repeat protein (TIGR03803 family)
VKSPFVRLLSSPRILVLAAGVLMSSFSARAANSFNTIYSFDPDTDGNIPYAALVQGADGNFYGVNTTGGRSDNGTIFSIAAGGGNFRVLNTFTKSNQGIQPEGGLVQATDGNFYGTTSEGGANEVGTLYRVIPSTGKLSILAAFAGGDPGSNPVGALIQGLDGFVYGTAEYGGADSFGTVFRADIATGTTTTFAEIEGGTAGINPESDLIQATDGNFYGTTSAGGANNLGTIFQITPDGVYNTVYTFAGSTDGGTPLRGLVQGIDGAFYGISNAGGDGGAGVIFRLTVSGTVGTLTPLYAFQPDSGDGTDALGNLYQASDGNFYGTTSTGGASGDGTVFRVTPTGAFLTLYSFADSGDSGDPISGLTQGNDGLLYGTTAGEADSDGTIFSIDLSLPIPSPLIRRFTPTSAKAGDTIDLTGDHLVGTTAVEFAGADGKQVAAASFDLVSKTYLSAVVPAGAVTGVVTVTANGLTASTPSALTITGTVTPPPPPKEQTVTLMATDSVAAFLGNNDGRFKITRTDGKINKALKVSFTVAKKSTAVRGKDYNLAINGKVLARSTDSVTIPAGQRNLGIGVIPIETTAKSRPDKTVILNLASGADYQLGSTIRAKVTIAGYNNG